MESLEPRRLLTASVINFDNGVRLSGVGVQDDGDIVVAGHRFDTPLRGHSTTIGRDEGVVFTVDADDREVDEAVLGSFGGVGANTYVTAVSPNGVYISGYGRSGFQEPYKGFRTEVANPDTLLSPGVFGEAPESYALDVSNTGRVVGFSIGELPEEVLNELSQPNEGLLAGISEAGAMVGETLLPGDGYAAVVRQDEDQSFLETPDGYNSSAIDISPNGEFIGGYVQFDDLTYFDWVQQAAVWQNGELTALTNADGDIYRGIVRGLSDNGYVVGEGRVEAIGTFPQSDNTAFIWHESFAGARQLDEFLQTEYNVQFDTPLASANDILFDSVTGNLHIIVGDGNVTECVPDPNVPGRRSCVTRYGHSSLITLQMPTNPEFTNAQGATSNGQPVLEWNVPETAETFDLEFRDVESGTVLQRIDSLLGNSFTPATPLAAGEYQVRVRAVDSHGGTSAWSQPHEFTIDSDGTTSTEATHQGTDGPDDLTIDVTGLDRVLIETGAGNDRVTLVGTPEAGVVINIETGDGNDIVRVDTTAAVIANLGAGNDRFFGNAASTEPVTVFAGDGFDRIYGGGGDDLLNGGEGNDRIHGRDGNDTIDGGNGRNRLFGDTGNDHLIGGAQRDFAMGGSGDDVIDLGEGNDVANGGNGNDIILGRGGNDRLRSGGGNDSLFGGAGRDRLFSSQGSSLLSGGDENDRIHSFGTDRIDGGANADSIRIFKAGTQVVTDETDTIRGPAATSSQLVAREENTALVDAAFVSLLALDSGYELPLL